MEEEPAAAELPQRQSTELKGVAVAARNLPPSIVNEVGIISRHSIQGLDRVVGQPEVKEVLFYELTGPGYVGVVNLLVEHGAA